MRPLDSVQLPPGPSSTRRDDQEFQGKSGGGLIGGHMRTPSINDSKLTTQRCTSGWSPSVPARSHRGMAKVRRTLAAAASRENHNQATGQEGVAHSVALTNEDSKIQHSNLLVFHFRTAVISRRTKKATALAQRKRLAELEKLAVKVSKASTKTLKLECPRQLAGYRSLLDLALPAQAGAPGPPLFLSPRFLP